MDAAWPATVAQVETPADFVMAHTSFDDLYRAEYARMVRVAWMIIGDHPAAEDVVQDAFIRVGRRYAQLREPAAYLRVAVVNACRNDLRRTNRMSAFPVPERTAVSQTMVELFDVLHQLDVRQRAAIVLRFIDDLPDTEIAEILGVRRVTVRSLVHRGILRLREVLP